MTPEQVSRVDLASFKVFDLPLTAGDRTQVLQATGRDW